MKVSAKKTKTEALLKLAKEFSVPLGVVTRKLAWLGVTGSGKTYGAMKLAELLLDAGAQIIVFDVPGRWSGLRLGPHAFSIPVFGGPLADVPLDPASGGAVADLVVERGISVVLDVSTMEDPDLWRFVTDFNHRFFQRKSTARSPVHVFYDECQELVPQELEPGQKPVLNAMKRQQKRGRDLGIGVSLISQRPQEVNKKVLSQAECVFAFHMTGRLDRDEIASTFASQGMEKQEIRRLLPTLPVGTAYLWSPQWLKVSRPVRILEKRTPDVSATPEVGVQPVAAKQLSPVDLEMLRSDMSVLVQQSLDSDPFVLRRKVADLEKQLRDRKNVTTRSVATSAPPSPRIVRVETPVLSRDDRQRIESAVQAAHTLAERMRQLLAALPRESGSQTAVDTGLEEPAKASAPQAIAAAQSHQERKAPRERSSDGADTKVGSGGVRRMLTALAQRPQGLSARQIGVRAGLSSRSGTFSNYLARARKEGWIEGKAHLIRITDAGLIALGEYQPLPTGRALLDYWLTELGQGGVSRLLAAVWRAYPASITLVDAAVAAGLSPSSGTFSNYASKLRALELVHGRGELKASNELFDEV